MLLPRSLRPSQSRPLTSSGSSVCVMSLRSARYLAGYSRVHQATSSKIVADCATLRLQHHMLQADCISLECLRDGPSGCCSTTTVHTGQQVGSCFFRVKSTMTNSRCRHSAHNTQEACRPQKRLQFLCIPPLLKTEEHTCFEGRLFHCWAELSTTYCNSPLTCPTGTGVPLVAQKSHYCH